MGTVVLTSLTLIFVVDVKNFTLPYECYLRASTDAAGIQLQKDKGGNPMLLLPQAKLHLKLYLEECFIKILCRVHLKMRGRNFFT